MERALEMFGFGKSKAAKEMDGVLKSLQLAFENNYKDNATANLAKFQQMYDRAVAENTLKPKEKEFYGQTLRSLQTSLKNFDHKKPAQW